MKNHVILLGWNSGCDAVIDSIREHLIAENRSLVLINQMASEVVEQITHRHADLHIKYVFGDFSDEAVLHRASIASAYAVVIVPDESSATRPRSDERTILATLAVKAVDAKIKVIAHILDPQNEGHLERANADEIVISDRYSGYLLGAHVSTPGIPAVVDLLLSHNSPVRLLRIKLPHQLVGKPFAQVSEYFHKQDQVLLGFVQDEAGFKLDDILSDNVSAIDQFIREKLQAAGKGLAKKSGVSVNILPPADYMVQGRDIPIVLQRV